jgi:hypothetical protein
VVNEEEIDFGYDFDFYDKLAIKEQHDLESSKRQLSHGYSSYYYSYSSSYSYSYSDYSDYSVKSFYEEPSYSGYWTYYSYFYYNYDYSSYSSSYSSYSIEYALIAEEDSTYNDDPDARYARYFTDETCSLLDFENYGYYFVNPSNETYYMAMYERTYDLTLFSKEY